MLKITHKDLKVDFYFFYRVEFALVSNIKCGKTSTLYKTILFLTQNKRENLIDKLLISTLVKIRQISLTLLKIEALIHLYLVIGGVIHHMYANDWLFPYNS